MMLESLNTLTVRRKKVFSTLNLEEVAALKASENSEQVSKDFDRIFLKLLRLIKYSNDKNNEIKNGIDQDTNNLLKKFVKYLERKAINSKIKYEQNALFYDICSFINFFDGDTYLTKVHNSIPKTSLKDFSKNSVGEQFFQISYPRNWGINGMPEGGSCSYWTVLFYNFFNKLKEAGLDLEISFFRFKNLEDKIVDFPSMRHSGLVIKFQGEDYFVDHEGIQLNDREPIVRKLNPYVEVARRVDKEGDDNQGNKGKINYKEVADFFENFKHENMKETDKVIFFDNIDDFLNHVQEYPEYQKVAFYANRGEGEEPDKVQFEFSKGGLGIAINGKRHTYYLGDNQLSKDNIINDIIRKVKYVKDGISFRNVTEKDREMFVKMLNLIRDKINQDFLYNNYTSGRKWSSKLVDFGGEVKVALMEK